MANNLRKLTVNNQTYTLGYDTAATADTMGLMSAADKAKLAAMKDASVTEAAIKDAQDAADKAQEDATAAGQAAAVNATAIGTLNTDVAAAKTQADKGVADAKTAQDAADAAQAAAEAAQTDVDNLEGEVSTLSTNVGANAQAITAIQDQLKTMASDAAITDLQAKVDAINAGQNLADMVADKAALAALASSVLAEEGDIKSLVAGDKVQVLADADHNGAATVYNWTGSAFEYIGVYGQDAYTKSEIDTKLTEVESHANKVTFAIDENDETNLIISVVGHTGA